MTQVRAGGLVCLVSDALGFRAVLAQLLDDVGWDVLEAECDREGVIAVAAAAPRLVLLDTLGDGCLASRFLLRLLDLAGPSAPPAVVLTATDFEDPSGLVVAELRVSCPRCWGADLLDLEAVLRAAGAACGREPTVH